MMSRRSLFFPTLVLVDLRGAREDDEYISSHRMEISSTAAFWERSLMRLRNDVWVFRCLPPWVGARRTDFPNSSNLIIDSHVGADKKIVSTLARATAH